MNAFQAQLEQDVHAVWFNPEEFGESHDIDGRMVHAILDSQAIRPARDPSPHTLGIYADALVLFVPVTEFGAKPRVGVPLLLDRKRQYRVADVRTQSGVYAIELEAMR